MLLKEDRENSGFINRTSPEGTALTAMRMLKRSLWKDGTILAMCAARQYQGGQQEAFTRAAKWKERGLKLATKVFPVTPGQHKPEIITEMFETSLNRLGTNKVDIFYLHAPDRSVPFEDTLRTTDELYKQGKFEILGLSNFTAFELAEVVMTCKMNGWVRPRIFQVMYNVLSMFQPS